MSYLMPEFSDYLHGQNALSHVRVSEGQSGPATIKSTVLEKVFTSMFAGRSMHKSRKERAEIKNMKQRESNDFFQRPHAREAAAARACACRVSWIL